MKKPYSLLGIVLFFLLLFPAHAQVGINTENPHTALDVNGSIQLRQELRVNGNPGEPGEIYFSKGNIDEPEWKEVNVPFLEEGQYQLINTYAVSDEVGIDYTGAPAPPSPTTVFNETFEANSSTVGQWTQEQVTGSSSWNLAVSGDGSGSGSTNGAQGGSGNARFVSSYTTQITKLISPILNFSTYTPNLTLSFYYGQKSMTETCTAFLTTGSATANNTLKVFYRTSTDGTTWTAWSQIASYTGAANNWTQVSNLDLPNSAGQQYYQIAFEGETKSMTSPCTYFSGGNIGDEVTATV